jgi:hypothetical protein
VAAPKSSSAQAGTRRKGLNGGKHSGPRKWMPWWVSHGKGSWFCDGRICEGRCVRSSATWSVSGRIVRCSWRVKSPTRKLTPPKKNRGGLHGGESGDGPRLVQRHQLLHHSGSEMPSGYSVPPRTVLRRNPTQACWRKARLGRGGQLGESLARESWWVSAEIG